MEKETGLNLFTILIGCGMLLATCLVFGFAPIESSMGIVQKIFYFHAASAYLMYLSWAVCTVSSILYLSKREEKFDQLAASSGELALMFAIIVMITGPLWGRKSWGAYWTWDPRLTSALLLTLIIVSYNLLRFLSSGEAERRFAAALSILGACVVPIIHLSVQKWRGQHPTVITGKGGGLAPEMATTFILTLVVFSGFYIVLLIRRYKLERNKRELIRVEEESATLGLLQ
jgi:heme exporter protein C